MIWKANTKIKTWLPKLQCHRGYWVEGVPQNTLQAIQKAYEYHYDICEFDVRLTADKKLILFHDAKFQNKFISDTLFADLQAEVILTTLQQLFDWFKTTQNFKLNIEIKNDQVLNYEIEKQVCELIDIYQLSDRVLISSFNPLSLAKVRYYNPTVYRALLLSFENQHGNNWLVKSGIMNYFCCPHILHIRYDDFCAQKIFFKNLSMQIPIVLWTVNDMSIYLENSDMVYGIISDRIKPEEFKKLTC